MFLNMREFKRDKSAIILRDLKTSLLVTDRTNRPKINKDVEDQKNITNQFDKIDNYKILHPKQ